MVYKKQVPVIENVTILNVDIIYYRLFVRKETEYNELFIYIYFDEPFTP